MPTEPQLRREIASFVRRSARMTAAQQKAWDRHRGDWVIDVAHGELTTSVASGPLDLLEVYGRDAPLIVEIGSGMGDSLVAMAATRPEANVLAFEVYEPAVAKTLALLAAAGLDNVRLVGADAVEGLTRLLPPSSIEELWVFFPDPWPKSKHHKRRLVDAAFATLAVERIRPGGLWRLATDWAGYAEQMRRVLGSHPDLVELGPDEVAALPPRPESRFARRAVDAGRPVADLAYRRR